MQIKLTLPDELVRLIDRERGDVSRSLWVRRQLESGGYRSTEYVDREREARAENAKAVLAREGWPESERSPVAGVESEPSREASEEKIMSAMLRKRLSKPVQPRPIVPKRGS